MKEPIQEDDLRVIFTMLVILFLLAILSYQLFR